MMSKEANDEFVIFEGEGLPIVDIEEFTPAWL